MSWWSTRRRTVPTCSTWTWPPPGCLAAHTYTADAIRRHGAIPSIEFSHSGQYAGTYLADRAKKAALCQYGPSDGVRPDGHPVKGLAAEQIADIVRAYGDTAALAKRAGYEMIMVHAGHSWLINQFLSPYFNHRRDEYGGSLENRLRFAREILSAVRAQVGPAFPIELRMSGSELFEGGYDLAEGCEIAQGLEDLVDLIHVSAGSYQFGFFHTHPSMFSPHGVNVHLAAEIKRHVSKPVATIGAINDPAMMEEILEKGPGGRDRHGPGAAGRPLPAQQGHGGTGGQDRQVPAVLHLHGGTARHPDPPLRRQPPDRPGDRGHGGAFQCLRPKKVLVAGGGVSGLKAAHHRRPAGAPGHPVRKDGRAGRYPEERAGHPLQA